MGFVISRVLHNFAADILGTVLVAKKAISFFIVAAPSGLYTADTHNVIVNNLIQRIKDPVVIITFDEIWKRTLLEILREKLQRLIMQQRC